MYTLKKTMMYICILFLSSPLCALAEDGSGSVVPEADPATGTGGVMNFTEHANGLEFNTDYDGITTGKNGGIYNNAGSSISINGIFTNNEASEKGGVIYNTTIGNISNILGTYSNNNADSGGGAVYNSGEINSIKANFISNFTENGSGGAIYNASAAFIGSIQGDFTYNSSNYNGGAIANDGTITAIKGILSENQADDFGGAIYNEDSGTISKIEGTFTSNTAGTFLTDNEGNLVLGEDNTLTPDTKGNGGAIANAGIVTDSISAVFKENTATENAGAIYNTGEINNINSSFSANTAYSNGGALYNLGTITNITATFTGNSAYSGGAIYNKDTIDGIEGSFTGNIASHQGGAIYNFESNYINTIEAAFNENSAKYGGALYNRGIIDVITGSFIENTVSNHGGAIFNTSNIGDIRGNFTSNTASFEGGAIYNTGTINSIIGDFTNNSAISYKTNATNYRYGGAIYNTGSIGNLSGNFVNNSSFIGGAIYNTGTIENLSASFIGNIATSTSENINPLGGAIYTEGNISFVADNKTNVFTDNLANGDYNAIYVDGSNDVVLAFAMKGKGSYIINDSITGANAYTVNITGENKVDNVFYLNNTMENLKGLSVTNSSLILGSYTHSDNYISTGLLSFASGANVVFEDSHLTIDMREFSANTINTSPNYVFDMDNGSFKVDANSTLLLQNIGVGDYSIVGNYDTINSTFWDSSNITLSSDLLAVNNSAVTQTGVGSTDYNISIGINTNNALIQSDYGDLLKTALLSGDFSAQSESASNRFLYNATQNAVGSTEKRESIIYGASDMAAVSGVNTSSKSAMLAAKNTIKPRYNFSSVASANNGMTIATYNEDGTIKEEYNGVIELASSRLIHFPKLNQYATAIWFMPMYSHESIDGMSAGNNTSSYKTNIFGAALGIDRTSREFNNDSYRIGLSGNIGMGKTKSSGSFDNINNNFSFYGASIYGALQKSKLLIHLDIGYSKNTSEIIQDLSSHSVNNIKADVETAIVHGALQVGYLLDIQGIDITPYTGIELLSMKNLDHKVEEYSALAGDIFNITSERQNILSIPLGVKLSTQLAIADWALLPNARLGAILSMGDLEEYSRASTTTSFDNAIILESQIVDQKTLDIGFGVQASKNRMKYALDINSEMSSNRKVFGLSGTAEFRF